MSETRRKQPDPWVDIKLEAFDRSGLLAKHIQEALQLPLPIRAIDISNVMLAIVRDHQCRKLFVEAVDDLDKKLTQLRRALK